MIFVDDEADFLNGIRRSLRKWSAEWEMEFVTSGEAALQSVEQKSDCVLVSDWLMPATDGPSLCEALRKAERESGRPRTYVILLTGDGRPERVAEGLDRGADDFVCKPVHATELSARIRVGLRVIQAERRTRVVESELRMAATLDSLTGLINRRETERRLSLELARVERGLQALCVCMVDVDHFKSINDRFGHGTGDNVLVQVAQRLSTACRCYDSVGRWGGEEFLVIVPQPGGPCVSTVANRLRESVRATPVSDGLLPTGLVVTVSVGATSVPLGSHASAASLLEASDAALYAAKAAGRDRVELHPIPLRSAQVPCAEQAPASCESDGFGRS